jgi:proteasome lid subunit RPN8/RPN11
MPEIIIPRGLLEQVITHCRACYPNEACGILSGRENIVQKVYILSNAEPTPVSYYMDPQEQFRVMKEMRKEGQKMVAVFHSHPGSPAFPSPKDVGLAFYADAVYIIVGLMQSDSPDIRAFTIVDATVNELFIRVPD